MKTILALFALALCASLSSAEISNCSINSTISKCVNKVHTCEGTIYNHCCNLGCECKRGFVFDNDRKQCVKKKDCIKKKRLLSFKIKKGGCQCDKSNNEKFSHFSNVDTCQYKSTLKKIVPLLKSQIGCVCKEGYVLDEKDNRCVEKCDQLNPSGSGGGKQKWYAKQDVPSNKMKEDEQVPKEKKDVPSDVMNEDEQVSKEDWGEDEDEPSDEMNEDEQFSKEDWDEDDDEASDEMKEDEQVSKDNAINKEFGKNKLDENEGFNDNSELSADGTTGSIIIEGNIQSGKRGVGSDQYLGISNDCNYCKPDEVCLLINDSHECQKATDYVAKVNV